LLSVCHEWLYTIWVEIKNPLHLPNRQETAQTESAPPHAVLIVEDYPPNILVFKLMIESFGFRPICAQSGAEALDHLAKEPLPPIAILMDVRMYGMDGYETTRRIRDLEQSMAHRHHIIGITAHALAGDREQCLVAGMNDYMCKPIVMDILEAKLKRLIASLHKVGVA
jgi:CheY-like chemotaxis protein